MPVPLIPIISALAAGGSLVPHAAGGLIVSSTASAYVAGTYLSTAAISGLITAASATLGAGALFFSGATAGVSSVAASVVGGAGIFGTTIGATGITGTLMPAGVIASTPVWVPIATGAAALGCFYGSYRFLKLKRKLIDVPEGEEVNFTEGEAKMVEKVIKKLAKKEMPEDGI